MTLDPQEKRAYMNATPQQRMLVQGQLSKVLSVLRAQYLSYQTSHWQSSGHEFYGNHLLFQRLYESTEEQTDSLAEKMVGYLGVEAVSLNGQAALISHYCNTWSAIQDHHLRGLQSEADCQAVIKSAYDTIKAATAMTLGMDDMLMSFSNAHDANEYLLQQVINKEPSRVATLVGEVFHQPAEDWGHHLTAAMNSFGDFQLKVGDPRLTWNGKDKQFHIDASDISNKSAKTISIENPATGNVALYSHPVAFKDGEGEVMYWDLGGPLRTSLRIWND